MTQSNKIYGFKNYPSDIKIDVVFMIFYIVLGASMIVGSFAVGIFGEQDSNRLDQTVLLSFGIYLLVLALFFNKSVTEWKLRQLQRQIDHLALMAEIKTKQQSST